MDEWDKMARDVSARIDYEQALRGKEYIDRLNAIYIEKAEAVDQMGDRFGVIHRYEKMLEALEQEFGFKREIDKDRFQSYWDRLSDGTYKAETLDEKKENQMKEAEQTVRALVNVFDANIPESQLKALEEKYGKNIHEELLIRHKQQQIELKKKHEQEAIKKAEQEVQDRFARSRKQYEQNKKLTHEQEP